MIELFDFDSSIPVLPRALAVALDAAVKATVLIAMALAAHAALGPRRALVRSALWNACLVGLLLLPAASVVFPRIRVTVPLETGTSVPESPSSLMVRAPEPFPAATRAIESVPSGATAGARSSRRCQAARHRA